MDRREDVKNELRSRKERVTMYFAVEFGEGKEKECNSGQKKSRPLAQGNQGTGSKNMSGKVSLTSFNEESRQRERKKMLTKRE